MAIQELRFSEKEFSQKDIASLPDRPGDGGITTEELKARFDQIGKNMLALGRFNALIGELVAPSAASQIGATVAGMEQQTVAGILAQLKAESNDRYPIAQSYNRGEVDAKDSQTLVSAKAYTDNAVFSSGAADMQRAIYDPQSRRQDVFAYADTKVAQIEGKGLSANDYTDAEKALVAGALQRSGDAITGALVGMDCPDEVTAQLRNCVTVAANVDPATLSVPVGTIIFIREE